MTTRPNKPQQKPMPDPPQLRQPTIEEAPHLYEDGVFFPSAGLPGMTPDPPLYHPTIEEAPHLYENGVYFPETDGMPLPDAPEQEREYLNVNVTLKGHYANQPNTFVSGNTFVYYDPSNSRRNIAPDCYVVFDVDVDALLEINRYRIWAVGKPPDFALEIASTHTSHIDLGPKRELYAIIGIGEYWRYDPSANSRHYGEPLVGERLVDGEYQRLPVVPDAEGRPRGYSPTLGLDLVWENGVLRFYDPATGEWLKTYDEEREAREAAQARAEAAQAAQESAQARAESAQAAQQSAQARAEAAQAAQQSAEARAESARAAQQSAEARADRARAAKEAAQTRAEDAQAEIESLREQLRRLQQEE